MPRTAQISAPVPLPEAPLLDKFIYSYYNIPMIRKLGQSYQIAIPKDVVAELGLKVEDYLDVRVEDGRIVLEPQVIVPRDQSYFFAPDWQKDEKEAAQDIRKGRVTRTKDVQGLIKKLDA